MATTTPDMEALRKLVAKAESAIDDIEQQEKDEPNRTKKKELQSKMKKLRADEKYVQALASIKEAEEAAKREAERAGIGAKGAAKAAAKGKAAPKGVAKEAAKAVCAKAEATADSLEVSLASGTAAKEFGAAVRDCGRPRLAVLLELEVPQQLDAALAGGKKEEARKLNAVSVIEGLAWATPFVLPYLPQLLSLLSDSKLGAPCLAAAKAIVENLTPCAHGAALTALPAILAAVDDKKWKGKAAAVGLISACLKPMTQTPVQLAEALPLVLPKLAEAALEVRSEVRDAVKAVLTEIGALVTNPEIRKMSKELVGALAEPTNQKLTQSVLAAMGNQTFMSLIDAASLALLLPIVIRGLKVQESVSKKWSAQIFGSVLMLVQDVELIMPYVPSVVPLLQKNIFDPVPEVQREAAKAFGMLEQGMAAYSRTAVQPWLFARLRSEDAAERVGASLALSEIVVKMDPKVLACLMPEIRRGALDADRRVRLGFLELLDAMPQALKMDFVPFIRDLFPAMLAGISGKDDDPGSKASLAAVQRYGDLCTDLLLPCLEEVYFATLGSVAGADGEEQLACRTQVVALTGKVCEKVLEHKKFGQDLLTCADCSSQEIRESLLTLVCTMRVDPDSAIKRTANGIWKTCGGAPKVQKTILPALEIRMAAMRGGALGAAAQRAAGEMAAEMLKGGLLEEKPAATEPAAQDAGPALAAPAASCSLDIAMLARGEGGDGGVAAGGAAWAAGAAGAGLLRAQLSSGDAAEAAKDLPPKVLAHLDVVSASVVEEAAGGKAKRGKRLTADLVAALGDALAPLGSAADALIAGLPAVAEAVARAALGEAFAAAEGVDGDDDAEILLRAEGLMLMYGAGHLLLKDTTLELKANRRYGVVAHNGAGKTTLMKEIASRRVVGMSEKLSVVHVDDSNLTAMKTSTLTAMEYVQKHAGAHAAEEALASANFPKEMQTALIAEMSVGWRMRLVLAVGFIQNADIVLLDEPTNHLDAESVEWLGDFLLGREKSSIMVISHEPKFLNKVCTDIIAYRDKKMVYNRGNFDDFFAAQGLKAEDMDALLSGNLNLDTEVEGEGEGEGGAKRPAVEAPRVGPPKLSFPIPGQLEGMKSMSRAVIEAKNVSFTYSEDKSLILDGFSGKLCLNSRVDLRGRNGCGKSTLLNLLCSEANPCEGKDGSVGECVRHHNLRLGYMMQDHLKTLGPYFDTSPMVYITQRFQEGYDMELQRRLTEPQDEAEAEMREQLAKKLGKYGNQVETLIGRSKQGSQLCYEVKWRNLDDPKQNTIETLAALKALGAAKMAIACDERLAAKASGLDQRPLSRREIVKHCEAFGIDEEMCCNRQIRGFSAGQKVRLSLAAMFWTRPHFIVLDEPTNYLDVETVEALSKALRSFRGGMIMISPEEDFSNKICNERWLLEDGKVTVQKLENGNKRVA